MKCRRGMLSPGQHSSAGMLTQGCILQQWGSSA
uniref:Uncharacterized protein n=1 Tax=Arundo donax TaxID=35708 RepID=A0A0A8Y3L8_ARUDO